MEAETLYKCCAPECPGRPYRASSQPHVGCGTGAAQLDRQRREWPALRIVTPEFMNTAADALAATRRFAEAVGEAGKARRPLNTQGTLAMIAEARRQLSNAERDLVRAVYRQERS